MSKKYKAKNRTKKIVAGIVAAVVAIAALAGIIALFRPNTKDEKIKINPAFSVGALDESGAYEKSESTLYTKDAFAAEGLETKVDFDATISYQLFYYDENVEFLSASGTLNVNHVAELPEGTEYARVMIMPDWTGVEVEDQEIGALDKSKYTSQIEFWVNNPDYVEVEEETEDEDENATKTTQFTQLFKMPDTSGVNLAGTYEGNYQYHSTNVLNIEEGKYISINVDMTSPEMQAFLENESGYNNLNMVNIEIFLFNGSDVKIVQITTTDHNKWSSSTWTGAISEFANGENAVYCIVAVPAGFAQFTTVSFPTEA